MTNLTKPPKVVRNSQGQGFCRLCQICNAADSGEDHWAIIATLIQTAKLNEIDPSAWLTDVLERIVSGRTKWNELHRLLPWN